MSIVTRDIDTSYGSNNLLRRPKDKYNLDLSCSSSSLRLNSFRVMTTPQIHISICIPYTSSVSMYDRNVLSEK